MVRLSSCSLKRFACCAATALAVLAVSPAAAFANEPSTSNDAQAVAPSIEQAVEPDGPQDPSNEMTLDSDAPATRDADEGAGGSEKPQAPAALAGTTDLDAQAPETPGEAADFGTQDLEPTASTVDAQAESAAPSSWSASVSLNASIVSAGTQVVIVPAVSGVSTEGFVYNYVWERDGWADWSSTVKETGAPTSEGSFSFYPAKPGTYTVMVDVTDAHGTTVTVASSVLQVTSPAWNASATADKSAAQVHEAVGVSADTDAPSPVSYNYVWERDGWRDWGSTIKDSGTSTASSTWSFTPTAAGTYNLYVDVIDAHGATRTVSAGTVKVIEPAWNLSLSLSQTTVQTGQESTLTPAVSGIDTSGFTYNYVWNYEGAWAEWGSTVNSTGAATPEGSYAFKATKPGTYVLYVDAISPSGTVHTSSIELRVTEPSWNASISLSSPSVTLGDSVTIVPTVSGAAADQSFTYNYVWSYGNWADWDSTMRRTGTFTTDGNCSFTPAKSGTYMLAIDIMDRYGAVRTVTGELKVAHDFDFSGVDVSKSLVKRGGSITVTPRVSGNTAGLTYNYVWMKDGWAQWGSTVQQTGAATSDASWTFTPSEPGNYTLFVDVIGADGVSETRACDVAVWDLVGVKAYASGRTWTMSADLGISNASDFGFTYNYVYNQAGAWTNWSSTVRQTGSMTSATSATYTFDEGGPYELYVDVVSPEGEAATAGTSVVTYTGSELDMWSRINAFSSPTNYLIACDVDNCVVGVYERRAGNWVQIQRWSCTTGAWNTPTRRGLYAIESKGTSFDSFGVRCFWYSGYSGPYLFHSICYWPNGAVQDGRLGMHLSHGCIRLATANAKWIYDTVPYNTTVYVY